MHGCRSCRGAEGASPQGHSPSWGHPGLPDWNVGLPFIPTWRFLCCLLKDFLGLCSRALPRRLLQTVTAIGLNPKTTTGEGARKSCPLLTLVRAILARLANNGYCKLDARFVSGSPNVFALTAFSRRFHQSTMTCTSAPCTISLRRNCSQRSRTAGRSS